MSNEIKTQLTPRTFFVYGDVVIDIKKNEYIFIDIKDGKYILERVKDGKQIEFDPLRKNKLFFHPKFNPGMTAKKTLIS